MERLGDQRSVLYFWASKIGGQTFSKKSSVSEEANYENYMQVGIQNSRHDFSKNSK